MRGRKVGRKERRKIQLVAKEHFYIYSAKLSNALVFERCGIHFLQVRVLAIIAVCFHQRKGDP